MLVDYHVHPLGHADRDYTVEQLVKFAEQARLRNIADLGLADHDLYLSRLDFSAVDEARRLCPDINIRLGLEVDYYPGQESIISNKLKSLPLDYCIGSVHSLDAWVFDDPREMDGYRHWDIDELYGAYYRTLDRAAACGLFDIIGHLDVIKVFGYRPSSDATALAEPALQAIAASGLCIEINTNGLYKPAAEQYPALGILDRCFDLGIPVTLSSDAHQAADAGRDIALAAQQAWQAGYRQVASFSGRKRIMVNL